jgi:type II secretory pathway pseudopilin PulG
MTNKNLKIISVFSVNSVAKKIKKRFTPLEKATNFMTGCKSRANDNSFMRPFPFIRGRSSLTGFTITELLVAIGLLAVVMAASSLIFNYSIDAQRTALATAEIMRTLRAITDQLDIDFQGLRTDGYLVLWSSSDANDALYFFSTGDFQSWYDSDIRSNIARIYFGPSREFPQDLNNLARDVILLTPGASSIPLDCCGVNFAACQTDIITNFEEPNQVLSSNRPDVNMANDPNDARRLLAQNVGSFTIEWTCDSSLWADPTRIEWFGVGVGHDFGDLSFEILGPPYIAVWTPFNQSLWPKALKFTFTLYDSKGIIKHGRRFEHIVYIGK